MDDDDGICLHSLLFDVDEAGVEPLSAPPDSERVPRCDSHLSELSIASAASTALVDAGPRTSSTMVGFPPWASGAFLIEVFCTFNGWIVRLEYPSNDNGWSYRADLGGHSQHRWEYGNVLILMARHSTCGRAVFPRELCRNCVMKTVWRRECIDPCNTFYLQAMNTVQAAIDVLRPLVYEATEATDTQVAQYMKCAPKASVARKRVNDSAEKMSRMLKYEQNLRESLCATGSGVFSARPRTLVDELAEELDKKDAAASLPMPQLLPSAASPIMPSLAVGLSAFSADLSGDAKLPAPSPKRVVVSATPSPVHVVKPLVTNQEGVVVAETVSSTQTPVPQPRLLPPPSQAADAYEALLDKLLDFDANLSIDSSFVASLKIRFPHMHSTHSLVSVSPNLDALMKSLGVHGSCQLMMKGMFCDWVDSVCRLADGARLFVGFYVPPSPSLFQDLYKLSQLPPFVSNATHRVEDTIASAAVRAASNGTRPVLIAYFGGSRPMIPGSHLLPLGIAC